MICLIFTSQTFSCRSILYAFVVIFRKVLKTQNSMFVFRFLKWNLSTYACELLSMLFKAGINSI